MQDLAGRENSEMPKLQRELNAARQQYAEVYADIHTASPILRLANSKGRKPVPLTNLREQLKQEQALWLEYLLGFQGGYVLVVPPDGEARVEALTVAQDVAVRLGIDAGPLTHERLQKIMTNQAGTGLFQRLEPGHRGEDVRQVMSALAGLWTVLVPAPERQAIVDGKYQRLIVSPDAALAHLPFETLVVESSDDPKYLLDAAPPIHYAPSATILMNLVERERSDGTSSRPPVLTIGDCQYGRPSARVGNEDALAELAPGSRYGRLGGSLKPLPHSAREIRWVSDAFGKRGMDVAWLERNRATEKTVRHNVSDRRIVHFACHGLVDQQYGNLFGALALTPGPKPGDPADDGFLTLAEIYELNLKGCELAILSACDTNVGPQQRGEGVWALSRGFLVAGARRVVASNWLVDDEAAASLVSYFCSIIAKAEAEGKTSDYAEALWKAKRWVRSQEEWQSPYYRASFVLVGPN
jgi:CHAT domain-containing protein